MDGAGPSSSHKRASSPSNNLPPRQRPKIADADVIDLTIDEEDTNTNITTHIDIAPMHLFRVRGIPTWANEGILGASLGKLIKGNMKFVLVSNFMIDMPWLFSACPDLVKSEFLLVCHGESGRSAMAIQKAALAAGMNGRFATHAPPLPPYGTYHSKAFLIQFQDIAGLRVIIHTANLLYCDCNNKTQGLYYQDFPLKESTLSTLSSPFEQDLLDYIVALKLPPFQTRKVVEIIKMHDFSSARVKLIASVPSAGGEFSGNEMNKYGYLKLKACLENEPGGFPATFKGAPVVCQYSSVGSLTEKWLKTFIDNFSAGKTSPGGSSSSPLDPPADFKSDVHLIWPAVEEVQNSIEGFFAGRSIPGQPDKVNKEFLQQYYRRYSGNAAGRQRAMPHMKSYTRFSVSGNTKEIAWFCLGSHNLSKAAWGEEQNSKKYGGAIFKILAYELSVLLVPSLEKAYRCSPHYGFSCTSADSGSSTFSGGSGRKVGPMPGSENIQQVKFVQWQRGESQAAQFSSNGTVLTIPLPIPYPLPPESYASSDRAWHVYGPWPGVDTFGSPFPGSGTHYGGEQ